MDLFLILIFSESYIFEEKKSALKWKIMSIQFEIFFSNCNSNYNLTIITYN